MRKSLVAWCFAAAALVVVTVGAGCGRKNETKATDVSEDKPKEIIPKGRTAPPPPKPPPP